MNLSSTCLPDMRDVGTGSDPSETRQPICGTFVRGTITGRVLTCGYLAGHYGDHQGQKDARRRAKRQAHRPRASR